MLIEFLQVNVAVEEEDLIVQYVEMVMEECDIETEEELLVHQERGQLIIHRLIDKEKLFVRRTLANKTLVALRGQPADWGGDLVSSPIGSEPSP